MLFPTTSPSICSTLSQSSSKFPLHLHLFICLSLYFSCTLHVHLYFPHADCTCNALHVHLILADPLRMNFPGLSIQRWLMLQHNKSQMVVGVTPTHTHAHSYGKDDFISECRNGDRAGLYLAFYVHTYVCVCGQIYLHMPTRECACVCKPDHLRGCCDSHCEIEAWVNRLVVVVIGYSKSSLSLSIERLFKFHEYTNNRF